jgi:hypothetical protein
MPLTEGASISGDETSDPPQDASDVARKVEGDTRNQPVGEKAKTAAKELDKEVSGEYEAKQENDAATDPATAPPRQPGD